MKKRNKWSVDRKVICHKVIRDSEFQQILAELGQLIYGELSSSQLHLSIDSSSIATSAFDVASDGSVTANIKKKVANE